jgi:GTP-binding protein
MHPMRQGQIGLVRICAALGDLPKNSLPELAVAGRSNAGKSSLINALLGRKLAHVSQTPGKTQTINYFDTGKGFYLVDLPGYGFARIPKGNQDAWTRLIEGYLRRPEALFCILLLLDARHSPSPLDLRMKEWLSALEIPTLYVAMKSDRVPRGKRRSAIKMIQEGLSLNSSTPVYFFSARTGEGKDLLWRAILHRLGFPPTFSS